MFKKIILILTLICMIIIPAYGQTGTYTTHNLFYLPEYGTYGLIEYNEYNAYMEIADAQIWANKTDIAGIDLSLYYLKTEIDTLGKVETIYSKDIIDSTELTAYCETTQDYLKTSENDDTADDLSDNDTDDLAEGSSNKYFPGFTSLFVDYAFTDNSSNWDTAYGWGDWSGEGFISDITGESILDLSDTPAAFDTGKYLKSTADGTVWDTPAGGGGYTNLTQFVDQTAWRLFYSNTDGDVTELALGTDGQYLKSQGATSAPTWDTPSGGGTVDTSGTPVDNDFAKFTDADTIEGRNYSETRNDLQNYIIYPQDYGSGTGTSGSPWTGLQSAYTAASAGNTIYLRAGYYQLADRLYIEKLINIIGEGIGITIIRTDSDANGIQIDDIDYCTIKNLTVDGDAQTLEQMYLAPIEIDYADWCVIENVEVKNAGYYGLTLDHCNHTIVKNFYAHDNCHHGVSACSDDSPANMYNTYDGVYCWNNGHNGFKDKGISDDTDYPEDAYNYFNNIQAWDNVKHGIFIACQKSGVISNCSSRNNGESGFELGDLEDFNIHDCISILNDDEGITLGTGSKNVNFTDVIVKNNNCGDGANVTGIWVDDSTNIRFTNCQSYDNRTITAIDIAFVDGGAGQDTITMTDALFLDAGFVAGEVITVSGSTSNNVTKTIVSVVAGTINLATGSLTAEEAGDVVTITQTKMQTHGLEVDGTSNSIQLENCDLRGNLTGDILNTANASIKGTNLYTLEADHDYNGSWETAPVGENVAFGQLLYYDWTDVEWKLAKANVIGTTPAQRIALATATNGNQCLMLVRGKIWDASAFDFGAARIYLNDDTAGTCDDTAPAESGDIIQIVGIGISADVLDFNPSIDVGEVK